MNAKPEMSSKRKKNCSCKSHEDYVKNGVVGNIIRLDAKKVRKAVKDELKKRRDIFDHSTFLCTGCIQYCTDNFLNQPPIKKTREDMENKVEEVVSAIDSGRLSVEEMARIAYALGQSVSRDVLRDQLLQTFDVSGRGELCRLLFVLADKKYEDHRLEREEWKDIKPSMPLGQVPVLTVGKTQIPQTGAIIRHLAREFGLYGKNNMENTMVDVIIETIDEVRAEFVKWVKEEDATKKAEISKKLKEEVFPKFITFVEKMLLVNGGQYLVGNEVTLADVAVFDVISRVSDMWSQDLMNMSTVLKAHCEKIASIPSIKAWLENRPKTAR
ncbi:prostaglandin-H2 D-isomerase / glutathione transferase [Mytilus galloprovincialis]|uniref:Prostaglandin-H2 D-isomerase / glutathione transferase n=1 Tax=Mytilus galloprovincialis TaxID=29158 RepID=A0A8B6BZQ5_MYTGA|nr:prostaglandin-H2 D-isomerase / glutathione transferase [Mytilus galloprovincialis]